MTSAIKGSRLNIRCDEQTRELLDRAASYEQVSVSEFVLTHALASAETIVQAQETISLSRKDLKAFISALDKPPKQNAALTRAFARHARQVKR